MPIWCSRSVFLKGTWQLSHEEVPTHRWGSKSRTAPEPTAAARMSGVPVTTWTFSPRPSARAASALSGPSTDAAGTSSGSFSRWSPVIRSRRSSYRTRVSSRLSVTQCRVMESYEAAKRPVSRRLSQSFGSRNLYVFRYTSGCSCWR